MPHISAPSSAASDCMVCHFPLLPLPHHHLHHLHHHPLHPPPLLHHEILRVTKVVSNFKYKNTTKCKLLKDFPDIFFFLLQRKRLFMKFLSSLPRSPDTWVEHQQETDPLCLPPLPPPAPFCSWLCGGSACWKCSCAWISCASPANTCPYFPERKIELNIITWAHVRSSHIQWCCPTSSALCLKLWPH